ncbi:MAG: hypothetical protein CL928_04845 [Deltaproteobacteria bacterium]|nr:hypothetical protein [Deltaproteobacteria bacterium]|tara:strand:+ start:390 stop:707 length:318 start_codon:yes stop_codon:yes gene_type:complete
MHEFIINFGPQLWSWILGAALGGSLAYAIMDARLEKVKSTKDEYARRLAAYLYADIAKQQALIKNCKSSAKKVADEESHKKWTELAIKHGVELQDPHLGTVARFN